MNFSESQEYRQTLAQILREEKDKQKRRSFLESEQQRPEYTSAREAYHLFYTENEALLDESSDERTEEAMQPIANRAPTYLYPTTTEIEGPLSSTQRAILFANQQLAAYVNLSGDRRHRSLRAVPLLAQTARYMLTNTEELGTISQVFAKQEYLEQTGRNADEARFQQELSQALTIEAKRRWSDVSEKDLALIIKEKAHNPQAQAFTNALLKGYFQGATTREERVEAFHKFAESALDLVEDYESLYQATAIGTWQQPEVLSRQSSFYKDVFLTSLLTIDNDPLLLKLLSAENSLLHLASIAGFDLERLEEEGLEFNNSPAITNACNLETTRLLKKYDPRESSKKILALAQFYAEYKVKMSGEEEFEHHTSQWPYSLLFHPDNRLWLRYVKEVAPLAVAKLYSQDIVEPTYQQEGEGIPKKLSLLATNGRMVDIWIPLSQWNYRESILQEVLRAVENDTVADAYFKSPSSSIYFDYTKTNSSYLTDGSHRIRFTQRKAANVELNPHPLNKLQIIDFPIPQTLQGRLLRQESSSLAQLIKRQQIRFLNQRGFRVPITQDVLTTLGYTAMDFSKNADTQQIQVTIKVKDQDISFLLDERLQLNLEGQGLTNITLRESIHYTALALLYPLLCQELDKDIVSGKPESLYHLVSRIGHMRELPAGKSYTPKAKDNYLFYEGEDLPAKSLALQQEKKTARHFTYVKPIIETRENLRPITFAIDQSGLVYQQYR